MPKIRKWQAHCDQLKQRTKRNQRNLVIGLYWFDNDNEDMVYFGIEGKAYHLPLGSEDALKLAIQCADWAKPFFINEDFLMEILRGAPYSLLEIEGSSVRLFTPHWKYPSWNWAMMNEKKVYDGPCISDFLRS